MWLGIGDALAEAVGGDQLEALREMYDSWPFFKVRAGAFGGARRGRACVCVCVFVLGRDGAFCAGGTRRDANATLLQTQHQTQPNPNNATQRNATQQNTTQHHTKPTQPNQTTHPTTHLQQSLVDLVEMVMAKTDPRVTKMYDSQLTEARLQALGDELRAKFEQTKAEVLRIERHEVRAARR